MQAVAGEKRVAAFSWRIEGGPWKTADSGSQLVLNVTGALLSLNPENASKLLGEAISTNIHPASRYAPGSRVGSISLRSVPGHEDWVFNPYEGDYPSYRGRCLRLGERCGVNVEVKFESDPASITEKFWKFFKRTTGGVPGQKDDLRGGNQWTEPCNSFDDFVGITAGNRTLQLYIRARRGKSADSTARMRQISRTMHDQMSDQVLSNDVERQCEHGRTVRVERAWTRDDEDEWDVACQWIQDQYQRSRAIASENDFGTHNDSESNPSG